MEEHERVAGQMFERNLDDIPRPRESCMSMSHAPLALETSRP
jgi:hypothetical protein